MNLGSVSPFVACCGIMCFAAFFACLFTQVKLGKLSANKPNDNNNVGAENTNVNRY